MQRAQGYLQEHRLSDVAIEVEVSSLDEVSEIKDVLRRLGQACRVKRVMLDNMTRIVDDQFDTSLLQQAVEMLAGV